MRKCLLKIGFFVLTIITTLPGFAWVYPEHRQIALLAIQNLSAERRAMFSRLWTEGSGAYSTRLTADVIDPTQGVDVTRLDFAAWIAIAGDHSCSPQDMLNIVLESKWIMNVAGIAARLKEDLASAKNRSQRINAIRHSDIRFQSADAEYATRAGSNNVHFLTALPSVNTDAYTYLRSCLAEGAPLNAIGAYAYFHTSALQKARQYSETAVVDRAALLLAAMADEAFALHFLEDVYAAGHIAGTWGDASLRKGTHDYYNEAGLQTVSWNGKRAVMMGDAFLRDEDAAVAAAAVQLSLEQLLDATTSPGTDVTVMNIRPDTFNVCKNNFALQRMYDLSTLAAVLIKTPVPALTTGVGSLPRFRAELGPFFGVNAALNVAGINGGFGKMQKTSGLQGGLEANLRFGFGLDGVLNTSGDGLVFLQVGWRQDATTTNKFLNLDPSIATNSLSAAIPGRSAYNVRLRLPFFLIPGDLLVAGPVLAFTSKSALQKMAVTAANGGLIPWQSGLATNIGRFQFVLGREVGVSFYGLGRPKDVFILPTGIGKATLLEYRSTKLDFPILEYRPLRTYAQSQSASLMVQLNAGVDMPSRAKVVLPVGDRVPPLKSVWYAGFRLLFNWRTYL
jgi:hypothetical protein